MIKQVLAIIILTLILTGCVNKSTVISVNIPIEELDNTNQNIVLDNKNTNTNVNTNTSINNNTNTNVAGSSVNNTNTTNINSNQNTVPVKVEIPTKLELDVDFSPQAPFGNWNELNEEACEEASMIIVSKYFSNQSLDEKIMAEELLKIDSWEKNNGYKIDLSALETSIILDKYFKLKAKVVSDVSVERIKYELSLGHLIIVPLAGRELQNPYFRAPGPIYHMLVIKGYNSSEFIVNEVGTKRGDSYRYKYSVLIEAIHDWNPTWSHYEVTDEQMESQPKKMIIVSQ